MNDTTFWLATLIFYLGVVLVGIIALSIWVVRDLRRTRDELDEHESTDDCRN
jgi:hypothetical protein